MTRTKTLFARVVREETGVSVIELVIASTLSMVILLSVLMTIDSGTRAERGQQARNTAMQDARAAMLRMTREARQAYSVATSSTRTKLDMQTMVEGDLHHVTYELASGKLIRKACAEPSATPTCALPATGEQVADKVTAINPGPPATTIGVFCYDPPVCAAAAALVHPRTIRISFGVDPEVFSGGPIKLATDVKFRNI